MDGRVGGEREGESETERMRAPGCRKSGRSEGYLGGGGRLELVLKYFIYPHLYLGFKHRDLTRFAVMRASKHRERARAQKK
jgi:hypothetical protein